MGTRGGSAAQALAGNADPVAVLRNGDVNTVRDTIAACHEAAGAAYIIAAGCEITRDTSHENVRALLEYAQGTRTP